MKLRILLCGIVVLTSCTMLSEPETPKPYDAALVLHDTMHLLRVHYPFLTFKNINVDSLEAYYSGKISNYEGDEITTLLFAILGGLKDGHVYFKTPSGIIVKPYSPPRAVRDRYTFSLNLVKKYLNSNLHSAAGGRIMYGTIHQNIGYIYLSTFLRDDNIWFYHFADAISALNATNGLILDVRGNGGGSDVTAYAVVSHFLSKNFLSPIWIDPNGNEVSRTTIHPVNPTYLKPVILLQNGACFSSCEGFIDMMRELPQVTTLGDTTGGGSGAPRDFTISYGYTLHLSTIGEMTYQHQYIEWNGLPPDTLVRQSRTDLERQHDPQLETALEILGG